MYKNNTSTDLIKSLRRPLLLQGPIGKFFNHLMKEFIDGGANPYKLNFNGGDEYFIDKNMPNVFGFYGKKEYFRGFLEKFIIQNYIDGIILFGDCRPLHKIAISLCKEKNIKVFVFEEGYIRPNYITLEVSGVNANSILMGSIEKDLLNYKKTKNELEEEANEIDSLQKKHFHVMKDMARNAMIYWFKMEFYKNKFKDYEHHKDGDIWKSARYWVKSFFKKKLYAYKEVHIEELVKKELKNNYFLVCLQVYNDSQIKDHSKFRNNKRFIYDTVKSFAKYGDKKSYLIIKQHPLDIPYHDYTKFIKIITNILGVSERVLYVHDLHLPTLIKNSRGLVTINSTTGLSSLYHGVPVIALGKAMYDIKGLCFQGHINTFWKHNMTVNYNFFLKFRSFLINKTQIVGSFYREEYFPKLIPQEIKEGNKLVIENEVLQDISYEQKAA